MKSARSSLLAVMMLMASSALSGESVDSLQATFGQAITLMQTGKFAAAVPLLSQVAAEAPDRPNVFWNLGIAAAAAEEPTVALQAWLRYRELVPADLKGVSKLIQSYQALGMTAQRDHTRDQLITLRAALPAAERDAMPLYVREQFVAGAEHVIAVEFLEPKGPYRVLYKFQMLDAAGKPTHAYTLESDDSDSKIAAELGQIKKDARLYSLDGYDGPTHSTYWLGSTPLSYDAARARVIDAASGAKPLSSSSRAAH